MVIDTPAILAWPKEEPERARIVAALEAHSARRLSAVSLLETQINMGDCAVYALAKSVNEPLLFVGNDFAQTDLLPC
jgi:ribonuclease VapC